MIVDNRNRSPRYKIFLDLTVGIRGYRREFLPTGGLELRRGIRELVHPVASLLLFAILRFIPLAVRINAKGNGPRSNSMKRNLPGSFC